MTYADTCRYTVVDYMWTCEFRTTVYNLISSWKWLSSCNRFGLFIRGTDWMFWAKNRSRKSRNTVSLIETYLHTGVMFPCPQWPYHRMQGGGEGERGWGWRGRGKWMTECQGILYTHRQIGHRPCVVVNRRECYTYRAPFILGRDLQGSIYIRERPTGLPLY